jgi:hypothetical protein
MVSIDSNSIDSLYYKHEQEKAVFMMIAVVKIESAQTSSKSMASVGLNMCYPSMNSILIDA